MRSTKPKRRLPRVLLLVDTAGAYGRAVVEGVGRYAKENGPWTIQYQYRALDSKLPQWLKRWQGDGIISRTVSAEHARLLRNTNLPLVELLGDSKAGARVGAANLKGDVSEDARMVAEHFFNCGLRQFAYFSYAGAWWNRLPCEAFCKHLESRGYQCQVYDPPAEKHGTADWDDSQRPGLTKWLRSLTYPVGILTPGDLHSVCLLEMCAELDIAVPEEIAIVGRGNDRVICETVYPTLSSLDLDGRRAGYEAGAMLDRMMAGKPAPSILRIPPSHIAVRQSTDLIAINDPDVAQAVRYIRECGCQNISVSHVADEVGLSRRVLEKRFLKYLGRAPKAEIRRVRIERAKTLLAQTDEPGVRIARKCRFVSLSYFTRAFHREVGITPNEYRKTHRISRDWGETAEGEV